MTFSVQIKTHLGRKQIQHSVWPSSCFEDTRLCRVCGLSQLDLNNLNTQLRFPPMITILAVAANSVYLKYHSDNFQLEQNTWMIDPPG